ncbi:Ger(x)C family spore germination protein [Paenibacillus endoradicis]|uniref:Ger(x)C family spore germination protein n=1 Tax=Paenibacillus endoradicis TaxID=2972487 RepID=UPI002158E134|nr:Ger(x)C family spore germination protein [Paenibacillus endoradicis]MCR8656579.1 Ger(x)C family spore germination protein [Paenibacillus endoradicis]
MISKSIFVLVLLFEFFLVSGCSNTDVKSIEKLNYVSSIGVDYVDGNFHSYLQLLEFLTVAKTDFGQQSPPKIWIGEGIGLSFEESLFDLYRTSQEKIYWGHMTAIVISESAIKQGFGNIYDSFVRYYEFRLTPWVYGTRESVKDIFAISGFFQQSPLTTILHEPQGVYSQNSLIQSVRLHRLISQINEPGFTSCIPTLVVNNTQWSEKYQTESKLMIDGAFFLKNDEFRSYIPLEKLNGLRWIQQGTIRASIAVPNKEEEDVQMAIDKPKTKLKLVKQGIKPQYNILMKATGSIISRTNDNLTELQQLTDETKAAIEQEIREVYQIGVSERTDILNLEHTLYRSDYEKWKALSPEEENLLTENTINDINIDLNITHSSSMKNKRMERSK